MLDWRTHPLTPAPLLDLHGLWCSLAMLDASLFQIEQRLSQESGSGQADAERDWLCAYA